MSSRMPMSHLTSAASHDGGLLRFDYDDLGSTNDQARALAEQHPDRVLLVTAVRQSVGRGRRGRTWSSPQGGAWFSLAWPWRGAMERLEPLPLAVGLAVHEALAPLLGPSDRLQIKWPNDLLLNDRKLAGILCEQTLTGDGAGGCVIVGVGINVNVNVTDLGHTRQPAASLLEATGSETDVPKLIGEAAARIVQALGELSDQGLSPVARQRIEARLAWKQQPVVLEAPGRRMTGMIEGIDQAGKLRLQTGLGLEHVGVGELRLSRCGWPRLLELARRRSSVSTAGKTQS